MRNVHIKRARLHAVPIILYSLIVHDPDEIRLCSFRSQHHHHHAPPHVSFLGCRALKSWIVCRVHPRATPCLRSSKVSAKGILKIYIYFFFFQIHGLLGPFLLPTIATFLFPHGSARPIQRHRRSALHVGGGGGRRVQRVAEALLCCVHDNTLARTKYARHSCVTLLCGDVS